MGKKLSGWSTPQGFTYKRNANLKKGCRGDFSCRLVIREGKLPAETKYEGTSKKNQRRSTQKSYRNEASKKEARKG